MIATSDAAYQKTDNKAVRSRRIGYSRDEIDRILRDGNPIECAALSEYYFNTNGLYKRIILHYATFLTYSWILVPYVKNPLKDKLADKKNTAVYYTAADFCTNFQIDRKCTLFAKEVLVKGAYYGLIYDTASGVSIQDLPFDYCRSRFKNTKDVDMVEFDMKFFDSIRDSETREQILATYPKYVIKAYRQYKHNQGKRWLMLPAGQGVYFSFFEERPLFLDLIPLLDDLDDYEEMDKKRNLQALKRILVQKIPHDGLDLVFEPQEAEVMHDGAINMLSNNQDTDVITTYADVDLLDMSSTDDEKTSVSDIQDLIYTTAGLSKEIFFSTTEAGLEYSAKNDLAMTMILGQRFANFFTTLLNYKFETKKIKFKFIILPLSYYNSADYTSRAKELAAFGYSFLTPILSTGIDQTNLGALKTLENDVMHLDEVLKPLQSSYTQTGKQQGQPISDKVTTQQDEKKDDSAREGSQEDEKESKDAKDKQETEQNSKNKENEGDKK